MGNLTGMDMCTSCVHGNALLRNSRPDARDDDSWVLCALCVLQAQHVPNELSVCTACTVKLSKIILSIRVAIYAVIR